MTTPTPIFRRTFILWLSWLWPILALISTIFTFYLKTVVCAPVYQKLEILSDLPVNFSGIAFGILCVLIVSRQPRNRIGWLCGAIAILPALVPLTSTLLRCSEHGFFNLPNMPFLIWLFNFSGVTLLLEFLLLPLWFPDGRFLSPGWRRFALISIVITILGFLLSSLWPGKMPFYESLIGVPRDNPVALPFQPSPGLTLLFQRFYTLPTFVAILIAQFSLFARWRRSDGLMRQQVKMFAFFLIAVGVTFLLFEMIGILLRPAFDLFGLWDGWLYFLLLVLLWVGYPVAAGVSVLKYRLYDVDVIIRKTLVYTLLSGLLGLVYFGGVALLQGLLTAGDADGGQPSPVVIVVTTLAIAALFNPLHKRIQDFIDRRFYRRKYDADKALAEFAAAARSQTDLAQLSAQLTGTVQETLQPEQIALWLRTSPASGQERDIPG